MEEYEIGSEHTIWINPFCYDVVAEVVAYASDGMPIVRTVDAEGLTLEPGEYTFPTEEDREDIEALSRYFKRVYGEEI